MKTTILAFVFSIFAFTQQSKAEQVTQSNDSIILTSYFKIKDALVKGNSMEAMTNAKSFLEVLKSYPSNTANEVSITSLKNDADAIAASKNIKIQRDKFASLSANMHKIAKAGKLSAQPVYLQYCPMKKATWLSNSKSIKNPYYGNSMLTCGSIKETL